MKKMNHQNNIIILLASNGNNIGKTTTAGSLSNYIKDNYKNVSVSKRSFASPIRELAKTYLDVIFHIHPKLNFDSIYTQENKNTPLSNFISEDNFKAYPKYKDRSIRQVVNELSDQVQELTSKYVWAQYAVNDILLRANKNKSNIIIYDDFRRLLEFEYLSENLPDYKIITVYLDKENKQNQMDTSYEGLLKDFPFTLTFTFTNTYDNIQNLFSLIMKEIDSHEE